MAPSRVERQHRLCHFPDMRRRRPAAAADDRYSGIGEKLRVFGEEVGSGDIELTSVDLLRVSRIRHHGQRFRNILVKHWENIERLVGTHHVDARDVNRLGFKKLRPYLGFALPEILAAEHASAERELRLYRN
jgi:hypothetical protein